VELLAEHRRAVGPVIPVFVASVQFSRTVERRYTGSHSASGAGLSKLNSTLGLLGRLPARPPSRERDAPATATQPGPVDMLGPIRDITEP